MDIASNVVQRIYTGFFLTVIGILAIFYSSTTLFLVLNSALFTLAAWEWSHVNGYQSFKTRCLFIGLLWTGFVAITQISLVWVFIVSYLLSIGLLSYAIWLMRQHTLPNVSSYLKDIVVNSIFLLSWRSFCYLKTTPFVLIIGLLIITLTDTLGYLTGKIWGGTRFAPNISPNKTWVGFWNALLIPVFLAILITQFQKNHWKMSLAVGIFVFMTTLMALTGDLLESFVKRTQNLKDSGQILPGHGGLLDRFDSIMIALPTFAANWYFFKNLG